MTTASGWVGIDHLLDTEAAAAVLGVSVWTMRRLRRDGDIPAVLIGRSWRYAPADLRTYINNRRTTA